MDKRKLSKKRCNILRRLNYQRNHVWRAKMVADSRRRYIKHPEPDIFIYNGEQYMLLSKGAKLIGLNYYLLSSMRDKRIIPDLPKHEDGRRYIIKIDNLKVIFHAIITLLKDEDDMTVKDLRKISDFVYENWNSKQFNHITFEDFNELTCTS